MKSILLAIFVVGMAGISAIVGNRNMRLHQTWGFETIDCSHGPLCTAGNMVFIDD